MKQGKIYRSRYNLPAILSRLLLRIAGWQPRSIPLTVSRYILIGAHHTSNWDFYIGYLVMTALGLRMNWVGKHSLFRGPLGWFLKWLGGIPVDRSISSNFVEQVVKSFDSYQELILALAPEGTRKRTDYWKSGFYHIALQANVPILFGYLDYQHKIGGIGGILELSGNQKADMNIIRTFYEKIKGKYPENSGDMRLRSEDKNPNIPAGS